MSELKFGIDCSRYQGVIDWQKVAAFEPKIEFIGIRGGISWAYEDPMFKQNWANAKALGLPRTAYFVIYPNENVQQQCDNWLSILGNDLGELPITIDVELHSGIHQCTPKKYQTALSGALVYLTSKTGRKLIIYTGSYFMDTYVIGLWPSKVPDWINDYNWWLAQYLKSGEEHPGPCRLFRGLDRKNVIIHQTSDKGDGKAAGMQSAAKDRDRWQESGNPSLEDMTGEETEPPPSDCEELWQQYQALQTVNAEMEKVIITQAQVIEDQKDENTALKAINVTQAEVIEEQRDDLIDIREVTDKYC